MITNIFYALASLCLLLVWALALGEEFIWRGCKLVLFKKGDEE